MNFVNTIHIEYYIYVSSIILNGSFIKLSICKGNEKWTFVLLVQQRRVEPKKPKRAKEPKKSKKPKNIRSLSQIEYQVFEYFVRSST